MRLLLGAALACFGLGAPALAADSSGGAYELTGGLSTSGSEVSGAGALDGTVSETTGGAEALLTGGMIVGQPGNLAFSLLARTSPNTVLASGNALRLTVPANAAPTDYELFLNMNPLNRPQRVSAAALEEALQKLGSAPGGPAGPIPQGLIEINLLKTDAQYLDTELAAPSTLRFQYPDADNDGFVDGTLPPVKVKTLRVWRLDETRRTWERVPSSSVNTASKELTASLRRFSVYGVFGASDLEVSSVYAFPVPWSPDSGNPALGNRSDGIRFTNLPTEGTIRVFNLKGELVRSLSIPQGAATLKWDVRTDGGRDAASGVYVWMVEAGQNRRTGKLMVIR